MDDTIISASSARTSCINSLKVRRREPSYPIPFGGAIRQQGTSHATALALQY